MTRLKPTPSEIRAKRESREWHKKHSPKPKRKKKKSSKPVKFKKPLYESYADLRRLKYHDYLKSKYWKAVRQAVLKRDNNSCVICGCTYSLQVHHDSYKHVCNELRHLEDVMTLCQKCHKEHHYAQM